MTSTHISNLPTFDPESGALNMVIETPRGMRAKYKYDEKTRLFRYDEAMPFGLVFQFDFGFLHGTLGGDGNPLDVLVVTQEPTFTRILDPGAIAGSVGSSANSKRQNESQRSIDSGAS